MLLDEWGGVGWGTKPNFYHREVMLDQLFLQIPTFNPSNERIILIIYLFSFCCCIVFVVLLGGGGSQRDGCFKQSTLEKYQVSVLRVYHSVTRGENDAFKFFVLYLLYKRISQIENFH